MKRRRQVHYGNREKKKPAEQTGGKAWINNLFATFTERVGKLDVKKMIAMNIPYLICFYLADKTAWLYRHCIGGNIAQKLGAVFMNFGLAFQNYLPSFHLFDLTIGILTAVLMKTAVYYRWKNAKKFRQGEE